MHTIEVNGTRLYYETHGGGEEAIVFSHGLLMNGGMFASQVEALKDRYRCIVYDHRGQGRSDVPDGGYDMDNVAKDAASLIRSLKAWPCHFVGLSMGGFVGMRLAIRHPELLRSLTLMETSADPEPEETIGPYRRMAFVGRWLGFGLVVDRVMNILFGETFMSDPDRAGERRAWREQILKNDRKGIYHAAQGVIDREGVYDLLGDITIATQVIVGEEDTATTPDKARRIHQAIPNSRLVEIPGAGHSSSIEAPEAVTRAIKTFIAEARA